MTIRTAPHNVLPGVWIVTRDGQWIGAVRNEGHAGWTWNTYADRGTASSYTDALATIERVGLTTREDNATRVELEERHVQAWHAGHLTLETAQESEHGVTVERHEARAVARGALRARA